MTHMTTRRRTAESVPPSNAKFLHARLPDSRLDVLETGHFACEDGADEYLQLTRSWIESHRAARSKA